MSDEEKQEDIITKAGTDVLIALEKFADVLSGEELLLVLNVVQAELLSTVVDVNRAKMKMKHVLTLADLEVIDGPNGMLAWVTKVDKIFRLDAEDGWKEVTTYEELDQHTYEADPEVEDR